MKKYIVFAISFILLFSLFQVISGIILTSIYTPDVTEAWNLTANLSQEVVIKGNHSFFGLIFLVAFLTASIAYFISNKIPNRKTLN